MKSMLNQLRCLNVHQIIEEAILMVLHGIVNEHFNKSWLSKRGEMISYNLRENENFYVSSYKISVFEIIHGVK